MQGKEPNYDTLRPACWSEDMILISHAVMDNPFDFTQRRIFWDAVMENPDCTSEDFEAAQAAISSFDNGIVKSDEDKSAIVRFWVKAKDSINKNGFFLTSTEEQFRTVSKLADSKIIHWPSVLTDYFYCANPSIPGSPRIPPISFNPSYFFKEIFHFSTMHRFTDFSIFSFFDMGWPMIGPSPWSVCESIRRFEKTSNNIICDWSGTWATEDPLRGVIMRNLLGSPNGRVMYCDSKIFEENFLDAICESCYLSEANRRNSRSFPLVSYENYFESLRELIESYLLD